MSNAKAFYGLTHGQVICALGPPKTGKSTFAGSVCEVVPAERVALLVTAPNEANSYEYMRHGLSERAEIFSDTEWDPEIKLFKASAYKALRKRLKELSLQPPDVRPHAYIIDSGTNVAQLKSNEILAGMKLPGQSTPPADTGDLRRHGSKDASFAYYGKLATEMQRFFTLCVEIAVTSPAFFIIPWHTQAPSEDEAAASGVMYEGKVLPMMEGKYRQKLVGDVDVALYTDVKRVIVDGKPATQYVVQIAPKGDRHGAVRSIPTTSVVEIPNNFKALHELMLSATAKKASK